MKNLSIPLFTELVAIREEMKQELIRRLRDPGCNIAFEKMATAVERKGMPAGIYAGNLYTSAVIWFADLVPVYHHKYIGDTVMVFTWQKPLDDLHYSPLPMPIIE